MSTAHRVAAYPVKVFQTCPPSAGRPRPGVELVLISRPYHRIMVVDPSGHWYGSISDRVTVLCSLERGWDGYGAEPVAFDTANFALRMLESICGSDAPSPSIVPGTEKDLQVEWHTDTIDIELNVRGPNDVHAWRSSPATGMDGEELELTTDFTLVAGWIRDLVESSGAAEAAAA